ncbi:MAG: response regulator, partial [bacterium]|nr:response regulator [bacterium]
MTLYIALCDDELSDLADERELIEKVLPKVANGNEWRIDIFTSPELMIKSEQTYNMVFLDVEMDGLSGIETAEAIHEKSPVCSIFFVTHHEDYMDEALDNH